MASFAVFAVLLNIFVIGGLAITNYEFKSHCGQTLPIPTNGQMLLTYSQNLSKNKTCSVTVFNQNTTATKKPRVLAYFTSFYTQDTKGCVKSRLDIYDDRSPDSTKNLTGANGVCSRGKLAGYYDSSQQYMTFKFTEDSVESSFQVLITAAHAGKCDSDNEFSCGNGYCISDKLVCNDNNNCGNHVDEVACAVVVLTVGLILAISFGTLVAVICIPLVIVCLICRPRRRMRYRQI